MLAAVERESAFLRPYSSEMPLRPMAKDPKGEKHVVFKKPLQNTMNQQKLENELPMQGAKKNAGRRRGRGKGKAVERAVRPEVEVEVEVGLDAGPPVSSKGMAFQRRPGFGQVGTRCIVKANHFLTELPDKDLNQYHVSLTRSTN